MSHNSSPYSTGKLTPDGFQWPGQHGFNSNPGIYPTPFNNPQGIPGMHREPLFAGRSAPSSAVYMNPRGFYAHEENRHEYTDQEKSAIALIVSEYEKCKSLYFAEDSISKRNEILLTMATFMDKLRTALKVPDFDCVSSIYGLANNVLSLNVRLPMEKVVKEKPVQETQDIHIGDVLVDIAQQKFNNEKISGYSINQLVSYVVGPTTYSANFNNDDLIRQATVKYSTVIGVNTNIAIGAIDKYVKLCIYTSILSKALTANTDILDSYKNVCILLETENRIDNGSYYDHAVSVQQTAINKIIMLKLLLRVKFVDIDTFGKDYDLRLVCLCKILINARAAGENIYKNYVETCKVLNKEPVTSNYFHSNEETMWNEVERIRNDALITISCFPQINQK